MKKTELQVTDASYFVIQELSVVFALIESPNVARNARKMALVVSVYTSLVSRTTCSPSSTYQSAIRYLRIYE